MRLAWGDEEQAFREELVAFLEEHAPPEAKAGRDWMSAEGSAGDDIIPPWARQWQATIPRSVHFPGCFCYVRTTPVTEAPKHKGISVLLIDMDTPGIEVRPLRHITGAAEFAEVFFTDVEVPATNLIGTLNDGWRITMASLAHERGGLWVQGVATCSHALHDLLALARKLGLDRDPDVRRRIGEAYEKVQSFRALGYKGFASTIAGGSSEIQRNIIAERILGLPRGA